jgi:hypothetical protein
LPCFPLASGLCWAIRIKLPDGAKACALTGSSQLAFSKAIDKKSFRAATDTWRLHSTRSNASLGKMTLNGVNVNTLDSVQDCAHESQALISVSYLTVRIIISPPSERLPTWVERGGSLSDAATSVPWVAVVSGAAEGRSPRSPFRRRLPLEHTTEKSPVIYFRLRYPILEHTTVSQRQRLFTTLLPPALETPAEVR